MRYGLIKDLNSYMPIVIFLCSYVVTQHFFKKTQIKWILLPEINEILVRFNTH
jgi:hypothetical protein